MKTFINYNILKLLKSKALMLVSGSLILSSCVIYTGGYSETDGVYYDPNSDSLPQGYSGNYGNQVDDYYDYDNSIIHQSMKNKNLSSDRYGSYNSTDWGSYAGTETYYSGFNNYGWGSNYYGWGNSYFPSRWGMGWNMSFNWGWGMPYYNNFYDPYWGYGGGYYPYGYGYGFGYNYYPSYGNAYYIPRGTRNTNGNRLQGMLRENSLRNNNSYGNSTYSNGGRNQGMINNNGGRNTDNMGSYRNPQRNSFPNQNDSNIRNNGNIRNNSGMRNSTPMPQQNNGNFRTRNFDSGSSNSGGMRSSGGNFGGSMNSGSNSGGSVRSSGGFRSGGR